MNRTALLQETSAWTDTVDLALCLFIYGVCNDCQFGYLSGSDFVNFMNLKPTSRPVTVCPKENLRVCYMVFSVSQTISRASAAGSGRRSSCNVAAYPSHIMTSTATTCVRKAPQGRTGITANPLTAPSRMPAG